MGSNQVHTLKNTPSLDEIQALEETLHRSETRGSKEALESLLAEEFEEFGASGKVYDRTGIVDFLLRESNIYEGELRTKNYCLKVIAKNAVLLTYETERIYADGSRRCALRSSIWKHEGVKWKLIFHQGTIIPCKSSI